VWRASWPEERIIAGTLGTMAGLVASEPVERTAVILVGPALGASDFGDSALYSSDYDRRFRPAARKQGAEA
jgi:precorrin-4/cobalt-precorrin-4 C11-methyltransferase